MRLLAAALIAASTPVAIAPTSAQMPANSPNTSTQTQGKHAVCINRRLIRSIDPDGPLTLRFRMETGVDYRSPLAAACHFTPGSNQFAMHSNGGSSDLCEGDLLDVVTLQSGSAFDSCQVGEFVAVPKDHP